MWKCPSLASHKIVMFTKKFEGSDDLLLPTIIVQVQHMTVVLFIKWEGSFASVFHPIAVWISYNRRIRRFLQSTCPFSRNEIICFTWQNTSASSNRHAYVFRSLRDAIGRCRLCQK